MDTRIYRIPQSKLPHIGRLAQALTLALAAGSAHAATYRVDTEAELVQAIVYTNTHGDHEDHIQVRRDIVLHAALPTITQKLSIEGVGVRRTIRRDDSGPNACSPTAANPFRLIDAIADLTLEKLELGGGCNLIDQGGAARVTGAHLRLEHSKISGNQTFVNVRDPYDFGNGGLGGGVAAMRGSMTIVDSEISGNTTHGNYLCAGGGVAIWYGSGLEIRRSTISGNEAHCGGPFGAAVYAIGDYPNHVPDTLTIDRSTIADNHAFGDFAYGGGISAFAESVTITGSIVTGNTIDAGTGVYGYARAGGVNVQNRDVPADTRIEDTLIAGNRVEGRFAFAGGVRVGGGTFELVASTVAGNVVDGIDRARAGGVMTEMNRATVIDSTISGNKAAGLPDVTAGGGVMVLTEPDEPADFLSINSTIAGNDATPGIAGGVFFKRDDVEADSPTALFESSIVAGNVSAQGADEIDVADETLTAPVVIAAHSLLQGAVDVGPGVFEPDSVTVALFGSDPLLQPLADNGGPTPTQALPCGSPAINQGTNTLDLRFDQRGRGFPRKTGHRVDIGAVETRCPH